MCCNNMWCYIDMSHCEWAVCGYEGFLVLVSLLYVDLVRFVIRLKYVPVAAGRLTTSLHTTMGHYIWSHVLYDFCSVFHVNKIS